MDRVSGAFPDVSNNFFERSNAGPWAATVSITSGFCSSPYYDPRAGFAGARVAPAGGPRATIVCASRYAANSRK